MTSQNLEKHKANQYIRYEALSNELAAKFYLEISMPHFASHYMQKAVYCYTKWGASEKVKQLEENYANLTRVNPEHSPSMISTNCWEHLVFLKRLQN